VELWPILNNLTMFEWVVWRVLGFEGNQL